MAPIAELLVRLDLWLGGVRLLIALQDNQLSARLRGTRDPSPPATRQLPLRWLSGRGRERCPRGLVGPESPPDFAKTKNSRAAGTRSLMNYAATVEDATSRCVVDHLADEQREPMVPRTACAADLDLLEAHPLWHPGSYGATGAERPRAAA